MSTWALGQRQLIGGISWMRCHGLPIHGERGRHDGRRAAIKDNGVSYIRSWLTSHRNDSQTPSASLLYGCDPNIMCVWKGECFWGVHFERWNTIAYCDALCYSNRLQHFQKKGVSLQHQLIMRHWVNKSWKGTRTGNIISKSCSTLVHLIGFSSIIIQLWCFGY